MTETRRPSWNDANSVETWNNVNSDVVQQFRSDNGKISSGMFKGARLLLLTTTGAKSGKERINPLAFTRDGDDYVIIASKGGFPAHPDWYHNVLANPEVQVEVATQSGVDEFTAHARIARGEERQRLYDAQAAVMPGFAEYQKKTSREIPVVVLEPRR
jgi:deazaflavin-dependent oxidoreductase (nitroreductase family)